MSMMDALANVATKYLFPLWRETQDALLYGVLLIT